MQTFQKTARSAASLKQRSSPPVWWIHLWSGLVKDPTSKHFRAMRRAVWLYLYLLIIANRRTGRSFRKVGTIASETGFSVRNVQRWLALLRRKGYIETKNNGRTLSILVTNWRPIVRGREPPRSPLAAFRKINSSL